MALRARSSDLASINSATMNNTITMAASGHWPSTGTPLSVVAFIGVIVLAGVVVNNAIVLVDRIITGHGKILVSASRHAPRVLTGTLKLLAGRVAKLTPQ